MNPAAPAATIRHMKSASNWLIPTGLLALTAIPVFAGSLRLTEMAGGAPMLPDGDRVMSSPAALATHIVTVTVFGILGAFQFAPRLRGGRRHRLAGRLVIPCGLLAAWSGLWLTLALPRTDLDSTTLLTARVAVVAWMTASLVLGFRTIRRRDFAGHRAWMIRGYAIGLGAGTQAFTLSAWTAATGELTAPSRAAAMIAAWLINAAVAELIIRRRRPARRARVRTRPGATVKQQVTPR
jgi:uncharacterized membrane protein